MKIQQMPAIQYNLFNEQQTQYMKTFTTYINYVNYSIEPNLLDAEHVFRFLLFCIKENTYVAHPHYLVGQKFTADPVWIISFLDRIL